MQPHTAALRRRRWVPAMDRARLERLRPLLDYSMRRQKRPVGFDMRTFVLLIIATISAHVGVQVHGHRLPLVSALVLCRLRECLTRQVYRIDVHR